MISWQAKQVWKRFGSWYGADALERKYGAVVPDDWCEVIDAIERGKLELLLADVRAKFPTWLPSLPEFEGLAKQLAEPARDAGPSTQERLVDFVLRTRRLTPAQLRMPWRFLYCGDCGTGGERGRRPSQDYAVTGVVVPADGDHPGYRVMFVDMEAEVA